MGVGKALDSISACSIKVIEFVVEYPFAEFEPFICCIESVLI